MKRAFGIFLLVVVFVAIFASIAIPEGIMAATIVFATALTVAAIIVVAVWMIF